MCFLSQDLPDTIFRLEIYFEAVLLGIIITGMPPYFAMDNAENHKVTPSCPCRGAQGVKNLGKDPKEGLKQCHGLEQIWEKLLCAKPSLAMTQGRIHTALILINT